MGLDDDPTGAMATSDNRADRIARYLLERGAISSSATYSELLVRVIREMCRDVELEVELRTSGIFLSEVGAVMANLCRELDVNRETGFVNRVRSVLADNPDIDLALIDNVQGAERLVFPSSPAVAQPPTIEVEGVPTTGTGAGPQETEAPTNWRPIDYEPPALIIFDQLWLWEELDGRRLDFDVVAESLREGGNGKILWVGPAVTEGLASLHHAIRSRGWTVVGAEDRDGDLDLAAARAAESADQPITVVSGGADMLDAIESVAARVFIVDEIRPFLQ